MLFTRALQDVRGDNTAASLLVASDEECRVLAELPPSLCLKVFADKNSVLTVNPEYMLNEYLKGCKEDQVVKSTNYLLFQRTWVNSQHPHDSS